MIHRYKAILILILFTIVTSVKAQQENADQSSKSSYKWDVSLDMFTLLKSGIPNVMIRYSPTQKGSYRLKLEGAISRSTVDGLDTAGIVKLKSQLDEIGLAVGYQWNKDFAKHRLFYGADVRYFYMFNRTFYTHGYPATFAPARTKSLSFSPFIGVSYLILKRLSVSAEMSLDLSRFTLENLEQDLKKTVNKTTAYGIKITPLSILNVSYYF